MSGMVGLGLNPVTFAVAVSGFLLSQPEFYQQRVLPWGEQENSTWEYMQNSLWSAWVSAGLPKAQLMKLHIDVSSSKCDYEVGAVV